MEGEDAVLRFLQNAPPLPSSFDFDHVRLRTVPVCAVCRDLGCRTARVVLVRALGRGRGGQASSSPRCSAQDQTLVEGLGLQCRMSLLICTHNPRTVTGSARRRSFSTDPHVSSPVAQTILYSARRVPQSIIFIDPTIISFVMQLYSIVM